MLANGWDNVVCTAGADLLARLPRRAQAAELVAHKLALAFLTYSADNPLIAEIGKHTFREVLR